MRSQSEQFSRTDQERGGESDRTNSRQAIPEMDASNEEKHEENFDQRAWWLHLNSQSEEGNTDG